jgi:hypothetical protein
MTDDLRTRIAVTIYHAASQWDDYPWDALAGHIQALYLGQADAVIAELGLLREWRATGNSCAGAQETTEEALLYGDTTESRYVTDWKADDE